MRARILVAGLAALLSLTWTTLTFARDVFVRPYVRQDGTYVQPHFRTAPDRSISNNYSTYPNINPYTGQQGTVNPGTINSNPGYNNYLTPYPNGHLR
jgi:hypothetical protein